VVDIVSLLPAGDGVLDDSAIAEHYSDGTDEMWLRVNFVSSVDGAATVDGKSAGLGGEADHRVFDILRTLCDVVLVASGTVKSEGYGAMILDDASVAARVGRGLEPQPTFAIVSGSLDLDATSEIFTKAPVRPIVITTMAAPMNEALGQVAEIIPCGDKAVDPRLMIAQLVEHGLGRIHCEGGPTFFGSLLAADVVDELCLTVSPLLVGGDSGRIVRGDVPAPRAMSLMGILRADDMLLLRYTRGDRA
jgi:riboflavin biosynthesis pyrimidine reductase